MKHDIKLRLWIKSLNLMDYNVTDIEEGNASGVVLMQATNMEDKNKKRVYFDDIVYFEFHDKTNDEYYDGTAVIISTISGGAGILTDWNDETQELYAVVHGGTIEDIWEDEDLWTIEVIGNVYENKNLIKEPQKFKEIPQFKGTLEQLNNLTK